MSRHIIFHHPLPLTSSGQTGSQVRPLRMLEAFKSQGYDVLEVVGHGAQRQSAMREIQHMAVTGKAQIEFVYGEFASAPIQLTEQNHMPLYPVLDAAFFQWCKKQGLPVGMFYRDIYWRFEQSLPSLGRLKSWALQFFHHVEWQQICRSVDHLFLPSFVMFDALPAGWSIDKSSALPPACAIHSPLASAHHRKSQTKLNLLYVGGVVPPLYDIRMVISVMRQLPDVTVTICCREQEWRQYQSYYDVSGLPNIDVLHLSGNALMSLYTECDVSLAVFGDDPYRQFAMPVKIFESMGYGVPIIASDGTAASQFITEEGVGWSVRGESQLLALLTSLVDNPDRILAMKENVEKARVRHTWEQRAKQVAETLCALRERTRSMKV